MPYYKDLHLLYVHIPKTGGSSVETHLVRKCGAAQSLLTSQGNGVLPGALANISLQHQTLATITAHAGALGVDLEDPLLRVFATVRNPYDRAISGLLWNKLISEDAPPSQVHEILATVYLPHPERWDNHSLPQHEFIASTDALGQLTLAPGLTVLRCEHLTADMEQKMGFSTYSGPDTSPTYERYLNSESIGLINRVYAHDFALLGYQMRRGQGRPRRVTGP